MAGGLAGRKAVSAGGGRGSGRACAVRFAMEGGKVCVADLDQGAAKDTARRVEAAGQRSLALRVDTTDEVANDAMVDACVEAFGAVDVLVAAAGVASPRPDAASAKPYTMLTIPTEAFRSVIDVNLYGVLFSNRAAARWMVANRRGGGPADLGALPSKRPSTGAAARRSTARGCVANTALG